MKFLHEMIAKKRSQQAGIAVPAAEAQPDWDREAELPEQAAAAALAGPEAAMTDDPVHEAAADGDDFEDWEDDDEDLDEEDIDEDDLDDDGNLFDDGSYDWDLEDAETQEIPEELDAPVAETSDEPVAMMPPPEPDDAAMDEENDDVSQGVSMVLKDLAARGELSRPEPVAAPGPARSSLEQNVEKLKIQRKIWDLDDGAEDGPPAPAAAEPEEDPAPAVLPLRSHEPLRAVAPEPVRAAPAPEPEPEAAAPQPRRAGRVKTRLLGFHKADEAVRDPFAAPQQEAAPQGEPQFPVGWMVVLKGPGRGASFTLTAGASKIGRGEDQAIRLDFGDTSISRDNHAAVAYDEEQRCFYIGHGGKANLVRLNGMPVLSTEPLADGDEIRIGETTLRFVAFCGPEFSWDEGGDGDGRYAAAE